MATRRATRGASTASRRARTWSWRCASACSASWLDCVLRRRPSGLHAPGQPGSSRRRRRCCASSSRCRSG
eukprot:12825039-Alexandrium_andersonii.AAC.1